MRAGARFCNAEKWLIYAVCALRTHGTLLFVLFIYITFLFFASYKY